LILGKPETIAISFLEMAEVAYERKNQAGRDLEVPQYVKSEEMVRDLLPSAMMEIL
jgi:hypothetical protein